MTKYFSLIRALKSNSTYSQSYVLLEIMVINYECKRTHNTNFGFLPKSAIIILAFLERFFANFFVYFISAIVVLYSF